MNFLNLLAAADTSTGEGVVTEAYNAFIRVVEIVMPVAISVILVFGIVYGIILGIKFAKAEDTDARDKAKGQLINMVIGVLVAAVIVAIIFILLKADFIKNLFRKENLNQEV